MHISKVTRYRLKKWIPYLFILLAVVLIISFQITHRFFINGIDTFFHMSVAYDTARQIQTGHFSYFLSAFGFYHSLRIVNAVYGPLSGYVSGILLLISGSWIRWQLITFLIVFSIAGISMYQLCRYWHVTQLYSVLIGILYIFSFPIMSMWLNSQYDGLGAAFMPWVLYFGSKILKGDQFKNWKLVLLLVILIEIHVFSALLGLVVLGLCYIANLFTNRDRLAWTLKGLKVLGLSLLLSFNVWGAIIEVLRSNPHRIIPTYSNPNMFQNVWSSVFYNPRASLSQNLFLLGLSTTLLLTVTFIIYLFSCRHLSFQLNFVMIVFGLGFLILSSRLVPWPLLQAHFPILDTDLQFAKRFLPVGLTVFSLILGILLTKLQNRWPNRLFWTIIFTIVLGLFTLHAWQNTQYQSQFLYHEQHTARYYGQAFHRSTGDGWMNNRQKPRQLIDSLRGANPKRYFYTVTKATPDYLPSNQKILTDVQYHKIGAYGKYAQQIINNRLAYHFQMVHHVAKVEFNRNSTRPITVPFVKYAHTQVTLNGHQLAHPRLTQIGAVNIQPRKGRNVMTFQYVPAWWYLPMMWISLLMWLLFVIAVLIDIF